MREAKLSSLVRRRGHECELQVQVEFKATAYDDIRSATVVLKPLYIAYSSPEAKFDSQIIVNSAATIK